ncbi:MAG: hypothetical protein ABIV63_01215 [Caldimonas sp.]
MARGPEASMLMTEGATLQHWSSSTNSVHRAAELLGPLRGGGDLADTLAASTNLLGDAAFVMVRIESLPYLDGDAIGRAMQALSRTGSRARLCLAGNRDVLKRIDEARYDHDKVGLMLDGVDAQTPSSQLIWDRIEAVRFHSDFIAAATHSFRLGCALEAMLRLSKSLGLCTLGEKGVPSGDAFEECGNFDYVQMPSRDGGVSALKRAAQAVQSRTRSAVTP